MQPHMSRIREGVVQQIQNKARGITPHMEDLKGHIQTNIWQ